jgi:hypothetical protein
MPSGGARSRLLHGQSTAGTLSAIIQVREAAQRFLG